MTSTFFAKQFIADRQAGIDKGKDNSCKEKYLAEKNNESLTDIKELRKWLMSEKAVKRLKESFYKFEQEDTT